MPKGWKTVFIAVLVSSLAGVVIGVLVGALAGQIILWIAVLGFVGSNVGLLMAYGFLPD